MLTYDAVLLTQERIEYSQNAALNEEVVVPILVTLRDKAKNLVKAAMGVIERLVELVKKAMDAIATFFLKIFQDSRRVIGNKAHMMDKYVILTGMKIKGYTFEGLNKSINVPYQKKEFGVDEIMRRLGCPVIKTWNDLNTYYDKIKNDTNNRDFPMLDEGAQYARTIEVMSGIKLYSKDKQALNNELKFALWGSSEPVVLEAGKDFTFGGENAKLINPPMAKYIINSYKSLSKKLDSTYKLIPFLTKGSTLAGKATSVRNEVKQAGSKSGQAHFQQVADYNQLNKEEQEQAAAELKWQMQFMTYYVNMIKRLSRDVNDVNRILAEATAAQIKQSKIIVLKALTYKTEGYKAKEIEDKAQEARAKDNVNTFVSKHKMEIPDVDKSNTEEDS